MYLFFAPYGFSTAIEQLFTMATTSREEAGNIIRQSQSEYDGRVSRATKRFWNTTGIHPLTDGDPLGLHGHELLVQDYVEAVIFEITERAALTRRMNRTKFHEHRLNLRTLKLRLKKRRIDTMVIRERVKACINAD